MFFLVTIITINNRDISKSMSMWTVVRFYRKDIQNDIMYLSYEMPVLLKTNLIPR